MELEIEVNKLIYTTIAAVGLYTGIYGLENENVHNLITGTEMIMYSLRKNGQPNKKHVSSMQ